MNPVWLNNHIKAQQCQVKHHFPSSLFIMTPACSLIGIRPWPDYDCMGFKATYAVLGMSNFIWHEIKACSPQHTHITLSVTLKLTSYVSKYFNILRLHLSLQV